MDTLFLSYSFDPEDEETRKLLGYLETLLRAHGWQYVNGAAVGGVPLNAEIQARIAAADGLLSILAPRGAPDANGKFRTSQYVRDELQHARALQKPCIALQFPNLALEAGLGDERERIDFDPASPTPALLKLVASLGLWKERLGRNVKVRLEPQDLARRLIAANGGARCEARVCTESGAVTDWRQVRVSRQVGGAFVTLRAPDNSLIQLRAFVDGETWMSVEAQQWVQVPLEREP
ncbi:MAG TPA: hypothetical protein VMS76_06475 [Planctomycetota bacterium]|nr:hypothetical protein [Planctomycetota bacterium]